MECRQHKLQLRTVLKEKKLKVTPGRMLLLDIFEHDTKPLSVRELADKLKAGGMDKVTLYRNVESLERLGVLKKVQLRDRQAYYELSSSGHHHHLVCTACRKVEDVYVEDDVSAIVERIGRQKRFTAVSHSLEFFGVCKNCK